MKIILTGGHPSPALAVLETIQAMNSAHEIVFVGRKTNNDREDTLSYEYQQVTQRKVRFIPLRSGRLTWAISPHTIADLLRIPSGIATAYRILRAERPDRVIVFGGYIALPVAIAAWVLRIPIMLHEQTIVPGTASRIIGRIATQVAVSFPSSRSYFPAEKTQLTGNPIRPSFFSRTTLPFPLPSDRPMIYVTGGSLGSHSINALIESILPELLEKAVVVHQTGNVVEFNDFARLTERKQSLPEAVQDSYQLAEHFSAAEAGSLMQAAAVIVSRAGANTISELIAIEKPAVLIPLPWSAHQEQQRQAEVLAEAGVAVIHPQTETPSQLLERISGILSDQASYTAGYRSLSEFTSTNAATRIVEIAGIR